MSSRRFDLRLSRPLLALLLVAVGGAFALDGGPARAEGFDLDGRMAPEMVFPAGTNGITPGTTLSSLRGRVVWLKFVLRDCPRCRRELPRAQQLHERWGRSGLVVLVVMHQYPPDQLGTFLSQGGYTFPIGTDPTGSLADRYGVRHRPTDYVIGIDGRVKASNGAPDAVILTELGMYRLARLGTVPPELESVRQAVWNWDYGAALRTVEASAARSDASAETREVAARLQQQARQELDARLALAADLERRRQTPAARAIHDRVVEHFRGTSLAPAAEAAREQFLARQGR